MFWLVAGISASYSSYKGNDKSSFFPQETEKLQENHVYIIKYKFSVCFSLKYALIIGRRTVG